MVKHIGHVTPEPDGVLWLHWALWSFVLNDLVVSIMAYRSEHQAGKIDYQAFMAAVQAYEGRQPGDSEAGRLVGLMVHVATERASVYV